jgi:cytochrome d ubiquinol oxidase subunit II
MHLYLIPLVFALGGLALYTVLGGADFGAGFWQLVAADEDLRDEAHHAMAPVWEANHVWLIFVLTVVWTAYPAAFGSIASTLSIPLFVAGIGIVLRGGAYALRSGTRTAAEQRRVDTLFAVSSILTPFALGTAVGGIASERVHLGNPGGSLVRSWLNPTSITIGVVAVATSAYMAAVFLSGDAQRRRNDRLAERFRVRALAAGVVAGGAAAAGLVVLHFDAERLFHRLTHGPGLPALIVSAAAGVSTLALLWRRRYEPARYSAALAVAAVVAGWAIAQSPVFLHGLTIHDAAAGHDTLVAVVVAVLAGGIILFPSLGLLFRLTLGGRLDPDDERVAVLSATSDVEDGGGVRVASALLVAAVGFLTVANAAWAHAIGVVCLFGFALAGYSAVAEEPSARSASVDGTK